MIKLIVLSLCFCLVFAGCGSPPAQEPEEESSVSASESVSQPEASSAPEPEPEEPSTPGESEAEEPVEPSQAPSSTAESSASQAAAPVAAPAPEYPAQSTGRSLNPYDVTVYIKDIGQYTVSDFSGVEYNERFAQTINRLDGAPSGNNAAQDPQAAFLLVRDDDYTKFQYNLAGTSLSVDEERLTIEATDAQALVELSGAPVCGTYAQWLIYMNPNRVVSANGFTSLGSSQHIKDTPQMEDLLAAVRWLGVSRGSGSTYTPDGDKYKGGENSIRVDLRFDNGVVYIITIVDNTLYVESTDMSFGCVYTLSNPADIQRLRQAAENVDEDSFYLAPTEDPTTGKPVIYLYPETATDVRVKLDFQGKLYYTFPTYNNGWDVTAHPDGTLINKADGSTHYSLFWDGFADRTEWDFSKGFVVAGGDVERFFQEKLPAMGLTPREYNDFITYWTPKLMGNPYNLITFSTTEYEETAPLTVSPQPDTVLRVHMVYKALSAPIEIEEQILPSAPARKGFTLVEWGGTRA